MRESLHNLSIVLVDDPRDRDPMINCTFINDDRPCKFQPVLTDRHGGFECYIGCWKSLSKMIGLTSKVSRPQCTEQRGNGAEKRSSNFVVPQISLVEN